MSATNQSFLFDDLGTRRVQADFSGGHLSSDGGVLLLRQIDRGLGLSRRLAECFTDRRHPVLIDHTVQELVAQRVQAMALGYEDLNDHDTLRLDPLLAVAAGKIDPLGENRWQANPAFDTRCISLGESANFLDFSRGFPQRSSLHFPSCS